MKYSAAFLALLFCSTTTTAVRHKTQTIKPSKNGMISIEIDEVEYNPKRF